MLAFEHKQTKEKNKLQAKECKYTRLGVTYATEITSHHVGYIPVNS